MRTRCSKGLLLISMAWVASGAGCGASSPSDRGGDGQGGQAGGVGADGGSLDGGGGAQGRGPGRGHGGRRGGGQLAAFADVGPADLAEGEAIVRSHCVSCHTVGRGDARGPDLKDVHLRAKDGWLKQWLLDPAALRAWNPRAQDISAAWPLLDMPDPDLTPQQIVSVLGFLQAQSAAGPLLPKAPVTLDAKAFDAAKGDYFDRCAGCHGVQRGGATGPKIDAARSQELGTDTLAAVLRHGTPNGMPAWGKQGTLSEAQIAALAAFLQLPPPPAPELPWADIQASWKVSIPLDKRPTSPQHGHDWQDLFAVVSRDTGRLLLFTGDGLTKLAEIDTGFAVHIVRSSASGRYLYAIGRDGRVTLVDLWTQTPQAVAEVRGCFDARSVEGSKAAGYEDKYLIEGCYWPSQYVVFDGLTLQPLHRGDVGGEVVGTGEPLVENRVALILASHAKPAWYMALKESGHVAVVDYTQAGFPITKRVGALRYLHDGGWDASGRYALIAANASDHVVVFDSHTESVIAQVPTGSKPHPGRGANWVDPQFGPVASTLHMGEGKLAIYSTDPGRPEAWKVVRSVALPSAGSLFHKTHPKAPWVLMDFPLAQDAKARTQVCSWHKQDAKLGPCWQVGTAGPAVHMEFNRAGTELWVSVWAAQGEIVIYDAVTLQEKRRIKGVHTPTGKFNTYNTAHDVY